MGTVGNKIMDFSLSIRLLLIISIPFVKFKANCKFNSKFAYDSKPDQETLGYFTNSLIILIISQFVPLKT